MFGGSGGSVEAAPPSPKNATSSAPPSDTAGGAQTVPSALNATTNQSEQPRQRRKPSKAAQLIASAKQSLSSSSNNGNNNEKGSKSNHKDDPDEPSPGANNNAAGDSKPSPRSTFRVGVTEDKNKKCRRTMEDTHSYLYNFLPPQQADSLVDTSPTISDESNEWDNGYFAIFDGHAGTFAADWCGKKLHVILEENIRKHPNTPIPELLDMTFTNCDGQLEKLPVKNSGCTAVCAVLRWEQRLVQNTAISESGAGKSTVILSTNNENAKPNEAPPVQIERKRVLYTANVGDARIVLCRGGKALRLSYDHKGSDENEGRRVANAGGLILNNRVNGVLAVTRALGDSYMKELVTGHPYTTETVLQPESDEFFILACDGLWDVCSDQEAVDLVRNVKDAQESSKMLVDYALSRFSSDNLSCMIVRLDPTGKFGAAPVSTMNQDDKKIGPDELPVDISENKVVVDSLGDIATNKFGDTTTQG